MAKEVVRPNVRQKVLAATWGRLMRAGRRPRRPPHQRKFPLLHRLGTGAPLPVSPDPVSLAVFAIDCVGPASVRACASGSEIRVAAPDEATAAVFRAALAVTARYRSTDHLVRVVVDRPAS